MHVNAIPSQWEQVAGDRIKSSCSLSWHLLVSWRLEQAAPLTHPATRVPHPFAFYEKPGRCTDSRNR